MPRPKPQNPLRIRSVRLNDRDWHELKKRGGIKWLRATLVPSGQERITRDREILKQLSAGASAKVVAARYHLSVQRVYNIRYNAHKKETRDDR